MNLDTIVLQDFAGGGGIEVPCDRIDAELDAIWRGIAKRARFAVHRACLLNVVIHAGDDLSATTARLLAGSLTDRLPARVILVRSQPDADSDGAPQAFVAASRAPAQDGHASQVAGELVLLEARGAQLDRVPAVIRAALVPDLTTTLWWTGPVPPARPWVAALRDLADRIVIDTEEIPDDADVGHLLPAEGSRRISDLTWPRLAPWRTAIARAFDDPANRTFLGAIDRVRIGLGAPGGTIPDASAGPLLAGWLAAALGWSPCISVGAREVCFAGEGAAREVRASIVARPGGRRGVVDVELAAGDRVLRVRRDDLGRVECETPPGFRPVRPAPFRPADDLDVLAAALLEIHADPVAPEAIRRAAQITAARSTRPLR